MKKKKKVSNRENSITGFIPDCINFILLLIVGFIFNWQGNDIIHAVLAQLLLLMIVIVLSAVYECFHLFKKEKNKLIVFVSLLCSMPLLDCCVFSLFYLIKIKSTLLITLLYFPFVLYANREIFHQYQEQNSEKDIISRFVLRILKCFFIIVFCSFLLYIIPNIFKNIGITDKVSFLICYSILCFPYKQVFHFLFSDKTRKKCISFWKKRWPSLLGMGMLLILLVGFLPDMYYSKAWGPLGMLILYAGVMCYILLIHF